MRLERGAVAPEESGVAKTASGSGGPRSPRAQQVREHRASRHAPRKRLNLALLPTPTLTAPARSCMGLAVGPVSRRTWWAETVWD